MKKLLTLALFFVAVSTNAQEETVTLSKRKVTAGEKIELISKSNSKLDINYLSKEGKKLGALEQVQEQSSRCHILIKNLDSKGQPEEVEVTIFERVMSMTQTGSPPRKRETTLKGQTVVLKRNGDSVEVSLKGEGKLSEKQKANVLDDYSEFVTKDPKSPTDILPERAIKVGESFTVPPEKGLNYVSKKAGERYESIGFKFTLKGKRKVNDIDCAVFAVEIDMKLKGGQGPKVALTQKGEVCVSIANRRKVSEILKGPVTMKGQVMGRNGQPLTLDGKGTSSSSNVMKKL